MPKCNASTKCGLPCQAYTKHGHATCVKHIQSIAGSSDDEAPQCSICYSGLKPNAVMLKCNHAFCKGCIGAWIKRNHDTCPNCRAKISKINDDISSTVDPLDRSPFIGEALDYLMSLEQFKKLLHAKCNDQLHAAELISYYADTYAKDMPTR